MKCTECAAGRCARCNSDECSCQCFGLETIARETRSIDITFDPAQPDRWLEDAECHLLDHLTKDQLERLAARATAIAGQWEKESHAV